MAASGMNATEFSLEAVITSAIKLPGVKVDRDKFLYEMFGKSDLFESIVDLGPVAAGVSREQLKGIAEKHILKRTGESSIASFVAGIPGGLALAASIPLDVLQFFGMALRLAQELSYLYGSESFFTENGLIDDEAVKNRLILYCGVMFGVPGAVAGVRALSAQTSRVVRKEISQKALTKTFWYPILKQICKAIGAKMTKTVLAKGVGKVLPVMGGLISGGLNFASMLPMARRLNGTLDKASFDYTQEEYEADIEVIECTDEEAIPQEEPEGGIKEAVSDGVGKIAEGAKKAGENAGAFLGKVFGKNKQTSSQTEPQSSAASPVQPEKSFEQRVEEVKQLKELLDMKIISAEEFERKKKELLGL